MTTISIKIDLMSGVLEVNAPSSELEHVFEKVLAVLPKLSEQQRPAEVTPEDRPASVTDTGTGTKAAKKRSNRRPQPSRSNAEMDQNTKKLGASFYKDFDPFDLGIGDAKEVEASEIYKKMSPGNNRDKVLASLHLLSKFIDRKHFNYDDIYQMLRIVGEKAPPGNMSGAVGELIDQNFATKEVDGIRLKIQGADYAENMGVAVGG